MRLSVLLALLLLLIPITSAFAYRPFTTEDAGVAGKGILQTEISYDSFRWKNGDSDAVFLLVSPIYGVTDDLELSIETPYVLHRSDGVGTDGVGDVNLVAKYALLWSNHQPPESLVALKGALKLNTGDYGKGLGRGDIELAISPVVSLPLLDFLTLHGQVGYTFVTHTEDPTLQDFYFYGIALDLELSKSIHLMTEIAGNKNPQGSLRHQDTALLGVTCSVNKHIIFDISLKKGIGDATPEWGWGVGAAIEF